MKKSRFSISGSTLKWIAIISMFIDHLGASFLSQYMMLPNKPDYLFTVYRAMRNIGRPAFPIFIFLLVEGLGHTKNVKKYMLRLFLFAFISEIPFDLAFKYKPFYFQYQNVFFTLFLGLGTIWFLKQMEERWYLKSWSIVTAIAGIIGIPLALAYTINVVCIVNLPKLLIGKRILGCYPIFYNTFLIFLVITCIIFLIVGKSKGLAIARCRFSSIFIILLGMAAATLFYTDYSFIGILAIVIMYRFRTRPILQIFMGTLVLFLSSPSELFALFALIPILLYNGTRGRQNKYFFYIFYPAHLLLLWLAYLLIIVPKL